MQSNKQTFIDAIKQINMKLLMYPRKRGDEKEIERIPVDWLAKLDSLDKAEYKGRARKERA